MLLIIGVIANVLKVKFVDIEIIEHITSLFKHQKPTKNHEYYYYDYIFIGTI